MKRFFAAVFLVVFLTVPCRAERIPILMYHDVSDARGGAFVIPLSRFDEHLTALENAGYHTVTFTDLIDYVYFGGSLPERPVLITSDDGYTGIPELAAPCAARHGMTVSCAVIGSLAGTNGHFSLPVPDNVELVSHTYALHDRAGWNGIRCTDAELLRYEQILTEDCARMKQEYGERYPETGTVLIYPHGAYSAESERILRSLGYVVTVTCEDGIAEVRPGEPDSLYALPRLSVWHNTTADALLEMIEIHTK